MKKILWFIAALVLAMVFVTGCEQESIEAEVTSIEDGQGNFNFSGRTLTRTEVDEGTWKTVTSVTGTTTTETETFIPIVVSTTTIVFNTDGTFTATETEAYAPTADGAYVDGTDVDYDTEYNLTGFAGRTIETEVITGTWRSFTENSAGLDAYTRVYLYKFANSTITTTTDNFDYGDTAITFASTGTEIETETYSTDGDYSVMNYTRYGTDENGDAMFYINYGLDSGIYTLAD